MKKPLGKSFSESPEGLLKAVCFNIFLSLIMPDELLGMNVPFGQAIGGGSHRLLPTSA